MRKSRNDTSDGDALYELVAHSDKEASRRHDELLAIFFKWDMEGTGSLEFEELQRVVASFSLPSNASRAERTRHRFASMIDTGRIPASGVERAQFVPLMQDLLYELDSDEFDGFIRHVHSTIEFLNDLTEEGRKKQAAWTLFMDWDADRSGVLEYDELETVIRNTKFFYEKGYTPKMILSSFLGTAIPENQADFRDFLERVKREGAGLDLQQFHKFLARLLMKCTEDEFYDAIQQIAACIEFEKKEYVVSKYIKSALGQESVQTPTKGASPSKGVPSEGASESEMAITMLKDPERNEELKSVRIGKIRTELRHAFDAVNLRDVEEFLNHTFPPPVYEIVAAAVCLTFKVQPRHTASGEATYLEALRALIRGNLQGFVRALCEFNTAIVNHAQIRRVMKYYFDPQFDSNRLVMQSWFLSALCTWVKKVVQIACLENDWVYPPASIDGVSADTPRTYQIGSLAIDALSNATITTFSAEPTNADSALVPVGDEALVPLSPLGAKGFSPRSPASTPRLPIIDTVFNRGSPRGLVGASSLVDERNDPLKARRQKAPTRGTYLLAPTIPAAKTSPRSPRKNIT
eukprot:TRINITY_DN2919_c0_g1_i1.p2 TRINITY_DN2919_c0_g1~~TRINITY_DN2919_c0_g1_i1.p2  ORF type:complete len:577 (-),score=102.60 TRINITY_DN2919_c0_g1_i1:56-1786(-)